MSHHHALIEFAKSLGYSDEELKGLTIGLNEVVAIQATANHRKMTELQTPIEACAESPKHRMAVIKANSLVKKLSGMKYSLEPLDQPVDVRKLNEAIRDGDVTDRMDLRTQLANLNLIP